MGHKWRKQWILITLPVAYYLFTRNFSHLEKTYNNDSTMTSGINTQQSTDNMSSLNKMQPSRRKQYLTYIKSPRENNYKTDTVSFETFRKANISGGSLILYPEVARLGNRMFEFASTYCTALQSNHTPTIWAGSPMLQMFSIKYVHIMEGGQGGYIQNPFKTVKDVTIIGIKPCCYEQTDILARSKITKGKIQIFGIMTSFKYLLPCKSIIKEQYVLQDWLQAKVRDAMTSALLDYMKATGKSLTSDEVQKLLAGELPKRFTYIGFHIRRTDKPEAYPSIEYIDKAIQHYNNKYANAVFYMCSDDIKWCIKNLSHRYDNTDLIFMSDRTEDYMVDFGILSKCNHSAITAGTFGFWTAWLAGGDVLYHTKYDKWQTALHSDRYKAEDFYPPEWIGID